MSQTIDQWIAETAADDEKDGDVTMYSLVHVKGISEQEVHTVKINGAKKWGAKELANLFESRAKNYAHDLSGVQLFYLLAFYAGRTEPQARKPFRINGQTDLLESMGGTEGPTGVGLTQQAMRHMEAVYQLALKQQSRAFDAMQSALSILSDNNVRLQRELGDTHTELFKLNMEKTELSYAKQLEITKAQRVTSIIEKGLTLGPAIINKLTGAEVAPQHMEDTAIIEAMAQHLDPPRIKALMQSGIFPPMLLGIFAARLEKYLKEQAEKGDEISSTPEPPNGVSH